MYTVKIKKRKEQKHHIIRTVPKSIRKTTIEVK
jgi:hypothetical protein